MEVKNIKQKVTVNVAPKDGFEALMETTKHGVIGGAFSLYD